MSSKPPIEAKTALGPQVPTNLRTPLGTLISSRELKSYKSQGGKNKVLLCIEAP